MAITIELSELFSLFKTGGSQPTPTVDIAADYIGQYVIVRTYSAGVHAGILKARNGLEVLLTDTQRLWLWRQDVEAEYDAGALTGIAIHGVQKKDSKISEILSSILLTEAVEILPTQAGVKESINALKGWKC